MRLWRSAAPPLAAVTISYAFDLHAQHVRRRISAQAARWTVLDHRSPQPRASYDGILEWVVAHLSSRVHRFLVRQNALNVVSEYRPEIASTVDDTSDFHGVTVEAVEDNHWLIGSDRNAPNSGRTRAIFGILRSLSQRARIRSTNARARSGLSAEMYVRITCRSARARSAKRSAATSAAVGTSRCRRRANTAPSRRPQQRSIRRGRVRRRLPEDRPELFEERVGLPLLHSPTIPRPHWPRPRAAARRRSAIY